VNTGEACRSSYLCGRCVACVSSAMQKGDADERSGTSYARLVVLSPVEKRAKESVCFYSVYIGFI
jgi:hypothetical protein